ncbi:carbohydrate kinase family protein [Acuticoccus sp.]|uniref:carbohydrate kinase family protein n=1 Tax=Acuticoccus sp. TaxID=1904378 RepID=UPI003B51F12F
MFVVCGEALWDLFAVERAGTLSFDARVGGSPFNTAVGLARLGQPVALLTGVSTGLLGRRIEGALQREGVDQRFLRRSDRPSTVVVVEVADDGVPRYTFYGDGAADRSLTTGDIPDLDDAVWGLHAGSFSLVVEPVGSCLQALFERESGRRLLTLDPNVRLGVEPDVGVWRARVERFAEHTDVVKASEEDIAALYPGEAPSKVAERWRRLGATLVVVTRGPQGAQAFAAAGTVAIEGRAVVVVDTVGAGDAFHAALVAGLAERGLTHGDAVAALDLDTIGELLAFAVGAAATSCTRRGADMPRRDEL